MFEKTVGESGMPALSVIQTDNIGEDCKISEFVVIRPNVRLGNGVIVHPYVYINEGAVIEDGVELFPGTVIGKEPSGAHILSRKPHYNKVVRIGECSKIGPNATIYYDVRLGANCLVGDGASIREQCEIGNNTLIGRCVTVNCDTSIGSYCKIMDNTHITGNAWVGDHVFVSTGVSTTNDNFQSREYQKDRMQGPRIMNHVRIGAGAILLPGVVIGEGALVGSGCLVTKDVDAYTLVKGLPARPDRLIDDIKTDNHLANSAYSLAPDAGSS